MTTDPQMIEIARRIVECLDRITLVLDSTEKLLRSMETTDAIITAELFPERKSMN